MAFRHDGDTTETLTKTEGAWYLLFHRHVCESRRKKRHRVVCVHGKSTEVFFEACFRPQWVMTDRARAGAKGAIEGLRLRREFLKNDRGEATSWHSTAAKLISWFEKEFKAFFSKFHKGQTRGCTSWRRSTWCRRSGRGRGNELACTHSCRSLRVRKRSTLLGISRGPLARLRLATTTFRAQRYQQLAACFLCAAGKGEWDRGNFVRGTSEEKQRNVRGKTGSEEKRRNVRRKTEERQTEERQRKNRGTTEEKGFFWLKDRTVRT